MGGWRKDRSGTTEGEWRKDRPGTRECSGGRIDRELGRVEEGTDQKLQSVEEG